MTTINLYKTSVTELSGLLVNTSWQSNKTGKVFVVAEVYINGWSGGYCTRFTDNSWVYVEELWRNATQVG